MIRLKANTIAVVLLLVLFCCFPALAGQTGTGPRIRFLPKAVVKGPDILLGEVAEIRADEFIREELARISLGSSPDPGRTAALGKDRILSLLSSESLIPPDLGVMDIPARIYVKRASQKADRAMLQKVFQRFLADHYKGRNYKLKSFSVRGGKAWPQGELSFAPDTAHNPGSGGSLSLHVDVLVDGQKVDRINLRGRVAVYETFACAARPLKRGERIKREDVYFAEKDIFRVRGEYARTFEELANRMVMATVNRGDGFKLALLKASPLVRRGEVVKLVARKQNMVIETRGICKEDGYANQPVRVENLSSGKLIRGMVSPDAVVEVLF